MNTLSNEQLKELAAKWRKKSERNEPIVVWPDDLSMLAEVVLRLIDEAEMLRGKGKPQQAESQPSRAPIVPPRTNAHIKINPNQKTFNRQIKEK